MDGNVDILSLDGDRLTKVGRFDLPGHSRSHSLPHSPRDHWPAGLGEEPADPELLKSLLVPYPAEGLGIWPADKRVGDVKNKDPSPIEPGIAG
jgi:hypothetical protein